MTYDRRPDRRSGGGRPSGGRPGGRPGGPPRDRDSYSGPPRDRGGFVPRGGAPTGGTGRGFPPRGGVTRDEGGMSIRLDPRRLAALKLLAGEQGLRPGELVTRWVEERLDAARAGAPAPAATPAGTPAARDAAMQALETLSKRVDDLAGRLEALAAQPAAEAAPEAAPGAASPGTAAVPADAAPLARRRGRPPKAASPSRAEGAAAPRVPLHEEISAVIAERGPMTAGELATAITERGRYAPPRSAKALDAASVNARVSNPVYRARFTRDKGRIGLSNAS